MVKELVPVVLSCAMWGTRWTGQHVLFHIDNMAVVEALQKGSSKEPSCIVMHLLKSLFFLLAHFRFTISACHIPGVNNTLADEISRNCTVNLSTQVPGICPQPCHISTPLWSLLVLKRPDWTSRMWRKLFADFILTV